MDKETISKLKLSELIKPFEEGKEISVLEFYNHIDYLYKHNPNIRKMSKDAYHKASNITEKGLIGTNNNFEAGPSTESNNLLENASNTDNKPLGQFGEQSLNQILTKFKEFKFREPMSNMHVTVNPLPLLTNFLGYGLILNSYMKHIHNRPFKPNLSQTELKIQHLQRRRFAYCFSLGIAPMMVLGSKYAALKLKDIFSIDLFSLSGQGSESGVISDNSKSLDTSNKINTSGLFGLFLIKLKQKLSEPMKLIFIFLFCLFTIFKLLGYNLNDIINTELTLVYFRTYFYVVIFLMIIYIIIHLLLLHIFYKNNKIKIPKILPEFLINWIKEFKTVTKTKAAFESFKQEYYIQLYLYLFILIFIAVIL